MKKIVLTIVVTMGLTILLTAFTNTSLVEYGGDETTKTAIIKHPKIGDSVIIANAYPCPCSKFVCTDSLCKGTLALKLDAFPIYDKSKKCPSCNGKDKSCSLCSGTGYKYIRTDPGCECAKCGKLYKQPDCK